MFERVLVPLDGSPLSEAVLNWVAKLGSSERTPEIFLLRVVVPVPSLAAAAYEGYVPLDPPTADIDELLADARAYLGQVAQRLGPHVAAHPLARVGEAGREIVAAARECGADLIAMSTHGRSGLGRLVLGSVADQVVRTAGLPVLLIRPSAAALEASAKPSSQPPA